jgi:hypothetical protein|tara:strand:- start:9 stop:656 length:648 start_codon:yes stop_codon:yes gene_type:complete
MKVHQIKYHECEEWLLKIHYAKRLPPITYSFGLYDNDILEGIVTYGSPPSPSLCIGICGEDYRNSVLELNRLCLLNNKKNQASFLVGNSLKLLPKPSIIVSYADTKMNHHGYIYQATNFIYTGLSIKQSDWVLINSNKHGKTISEQYTLEERKNNPDKFKIVQRSRKHRYIYFLGDKKQKKEMLGKLNYNIEPYPKGDNKNYEVGHKPTVQGLLF